MCSFQFWYISITSSTFAPGYQKGAEVIVPSFTFIATANAPLFVGAKPVFADIEERKLIKYNWVVQYKKNLKLDHKTDIGAFTYINAKNGVVIEDFVQIGSHCSLYSESTIDNKAGQIKLKKNCKIGSHSLIMPGVTVGENAVIGAFSFVNRNVPDNVVAAGVPVKVIKKLEGE